MSDSLPFQDTAVVASKTNESESSRNRTVLPRVEVGDGDVQLLQYEGERYESLKKLGEGGAGEVVLVKDQDIQRVVAMKTVKTSKDRHNLVRFVEEVRTVGQLEHPNIVPIHDVGVGADGQFYFTMKYIEGETLRDIISELQDGNPAYHAKYTIERRLQIFLEILHAIHFAHDQGYIHRDIKPENVMVGRYGEVMVMDWGIAKKIRDTRASVLDTVLARNAEQGQIQDGRVFQTQQGTLIGTPAYMSPEQVKGEVAQLDERTDIFSLSAMLYELLTLHHYLEKYGNDAKSLLLGVLMQEPADAEEITSPYQGKVPREHAFFLRQGMQKKPENRFQSVADMIQELQNNMQGRICVHCPSTYAKRQIFDYGRFLDNHRHWGVAILIAIVILSALGVIQLVSWILRFFG